MRNKIITFFFCNQLIEFAAQARKAFFGKSTLLFTATQCACQSPADPAAIFSAI
jgi:hypothetical protein